MPVILRKGILLVDVAVNLFQSRLCLTFDNTGSVVVQNNMIPVVGANGIGKGDILGGGSAVLIHGLEGVLCLAGLVAIPVHL